MTNLPEPLTPADCDLRDFPSMLLDVVRLRDSELAAGESAEAFRAAVLSWCVGWHQLPAASLPNDDAKLAYLLGYGRDLTTWREVRAAGGLRGWVLCSDGRLYHPVVAAKALAAVEVKSKQRDKTEAARLAKAEKAAAEARRRAQEASGPGGPGGEQSTGDAMPSDQADATASDDVAPTASVAPSVTVSVTEPVTGSKGREGKGREVKEEDAEAAPPTPVEPSSAEPRTARDMVWQDGVAIVTSLTGKTQPRVRSMIGRWLSQLQDDCPRLMLILHEAQQARPVDAVSWITRSVANGARASPGGRDDGLPTMRDVGAAVRSRVGEAEWRTI